MATEDFLLPRDEDLPFEEEVLRNPYVVRTWTQYLSFKHDAPPHVRNLLYERAVKALPGSYKLWYPYLVERKMQVRGRSLNDPAYESANSAFERCLQFLHKMPRIWIEYIDLLISQKKITRTRRTIDRALRSLSVGQHDRIWKIALKFINGVQEIPVPTATRLFRRYCKWDPKGIEDFIDYLVKAGAYDEAARQITTIVNMDNFSSTKDKTQHDYWLMFCDIVSKHSDEITSVKADAIVRSGLKRYSDQVGKLWTTLADYHIRLGHFDKARDVFEEGMNTVITLRDFTQIWDAYAKFEDTLIASAVKAMDENKSKEEDEEEMLEFDLRVARYENLIERQPLLTNSVLLRQNPHNVHEWLKRATLYGDNLPMVVDTFTEAIKTIDPKKAKGKLHSLWVAFAQVYEKHGDIASARKIFENALKVEYRYVEDLASVWCEYAEMELRTKNFQQARILLQRATTPVRGLRRTAEKEPVQARVHKSTRLWSFYVDVEENLGTFLSTKTVYDKMIDMRAVTPQVVINYAHYLAENKYFEESFKAYEKGISLFAFPHVMPIWVTYLSKFTERYGGRKLERARELFEQVIASAPAKDVKIFYVMYAQLEEEYGLARRAMAIYDRATKAVSEEERFAMFSLYISKATEFFGVARTREIYERAIEVLNDKQAKDMCLRYAELERKLGEIDRARAIFVHASQFCDPRVEPEFWQKWRQFEVDHGNKETFREMLRIKRSIQASFSGSLNFLSQEILQAQKTQPQQQAFVPSNDMMALEALASKNREQKEADAAKEASMEEEPVSEEEAEEEEEGEGANIQLEQMSVPSSVFERNVPAEATGEKMGALERLKRKRDGGK